MDSLSATLREKQSLLSDEVAAAFDHIAGIVERRRADVLREVSNREAAKQATLAKQKEELETRGAIQWTLLIFWHQTGPCSVLGHYKFRHVSKLLT